MTFKQIQDAVIADRFDESQRADVKNWINDCYDTLVGMEEWSFKLATSNVTVTAGSAGVASVPVGIGSVRALNRADGTPLNYLTPEAYADRYFGQTSTGLPEDYTVIEDAAIITVGPLSSESSTRYELTFEYEASPLVNDGTYPIVPTLAHMALVYGAAATGLTLAQDYDGATAMEQKFEQRYQSMRRRYLTVSRVKQSQSPAYRPC